jgi:phage-related protein
MSISIFNILDWEQTTSYNKNDILKKNNKFYYVLSSNYVSSTSLENDINNGYLNGYIMDNNENKPLFLWTPSYNLSSDFQPKIKSTKFGDGYEQISPDGINSNLLIFNLEFNNRNLDETTAILHFLFMRNGSESFVWVTPPPVANQLRFKCKQWNYKENFYNNYSITAQFLQSVR